MTSMHASTHGIKHGSHDVTQVGTHDTWNISVIPGGYKLGEIEIYIISEFTLRKKIMNYWKYQSEKGHIKSYAMFLGKLC